MYEDLIEKKKNQLQLSPTLLGFTDPKVDLAQIIFTPGIKGKDDFTYYYPHQDVETRENLVLSFGQLIIAIDPLTNTFIGGKAFGSGESIDEYGISGSSYTFINEKSLPYVLIESHLDGQDFFAAIIDITNNTFKVVKLMDLDNRPRFDFKVQHARWENTSILFNFLDVEQINIPKELLEGKDLTTMSETEIYSLSRQVEQVLSRSNQYEKVICDVNIGSHTPLCEGLKGIINYSYSHEGLLKHESAPNSEPI